ncbi:T-cell antigen CD7 [Dendropsophus ebraccatus]|uniref:T-cell antigen CD7 n=1 Tax=Dendropsophus ebraccatus TaxID=150705 RepID=UPI00383215F6
MMLCLALVFACFLPGTLASRCSTGDGVHDGITQNPRVVETAEGVNVSFTCTIDDKYKVSTIYVRKDGTNVMVRNVSDVIYKEENVFFSGTTHHFTITLTVRDKSDSNTYYCDTVVQGQPTEICGAGTFIKILVIDTRFTFRHEIFWPTVLLTVPPGILILWLLSKKWCF